MTFVSGPVGWQCLERQEQSDEGSGQRDGLDTTDDDGQLIGRVAVGVKDAGIKPRLAPAAADRPGNMPFQQAPNLGNKSCLGTLFF